MGIRFLCPNGHKLNVKSFLAGKRGICPDCDAKFLVPFESGGKVAAIIEEREAPLSQVASTPLSAVSLPPEVGTGLATDVWHLRSAAGVQQGPATISLMKTWISEGRVDRDSWVWRTGWLDWQRASDVFPELGAVLGSPASAAPRSFVEESLVLQVDGPLPNEADVLNSHRRKRRQRRDRARSITLLLGGVICLLAIALIVVLLK